MNTESNLFRGNPIDRNAPFYFDPFAYSRLHHEPVAVVVGELGMGKASQMKTVCVRPEESGDDSNLPLPDSTN